MKLTTVAFAALSAVVTAAPAHAHSWNSITTNGITTNGIAYNALLSNGLEVNGTAYNSLVTNGAAYNALVSNGAAQQGSAGAKLVTCVTGAEPVCELAPAFEVRSVTLGNGRKLELH